MSEREKEMKIIGKHQSWKSVTRHKETSHESENCVLQGEWGESTYSSVRRRLLNWKTKAVGKLAAVPEEEGGGGGGGTWI